MPEYEKQNNTTMKFGTHAKSLRIRARITLRAFAKQVGMDPSNWSKIERGIIPPPANDTLIPTISQNLNLAEEETQQLHDLASMARGELPRDIDDHELLAKMPAFFRALKGREYTADDLEKLTQKIKDLNIP